MNSRHQLTPLDVSALRQTRDTLAGRRDLMRITFDVLTHPYAENRSRLNAYATLPRQDPTITTLIQRADILASQISSQSPPSAVVLEHLAELTRKPKVAEFILSCNVLDIINTGLKTLTPLAEPPIYHRTMLPYQTKIIYYGLEIIRNLVLNTTHAAERACTMNIPRTIWFFTTDEYDPERGTTSTYDSDDSRNKKTKATDRLTAAGKKRASSSSHPHAKRTKQSNPRNSGDDDYYPPSNNNVVYHYFTLAETTLRAIRDKTVTYLETLSDDIWANDNSVDRILTQLVEPPIPRSPVEPPPSPDHNHS